MSRTRKDAPLTRPTVTVPAEWDLAGLLRLPVRDSDLILKQLDQQVSQVEARRPTLAPDMTVGGFQDILRLLEEIASLSSKLSAYAYLWYSENTKRPEARAFKTKVEERLAALQNRILFFDLWWQSVDAANADRLLASSGDLRYHLETIRRFKPHTLSEPEEKLINLKNTTGRSAVNTLYDLLTNGLTFTLTLNGKRKTLTREQLSMYIRSPKAGVREAAYKELHRVFGGQQDMLGEMYSTLVSDWKNENITLRKFSEPVAARNLSNDVPDEAVTALLSVCTKNAAVFQEYFRLKGRLCGITRMNRYHLYAPHPADRGRYRYQDAVRMVLDAYQGFSPELADLVRRVIDERHLDARMRPGKLSGAYCYSVVPGLTPYVLLNYTGEARDVATLAHELGHAVHGLLAADHSVFTFHATLPLAETASVFGERILSDALMAQETRKSVKQGLLISQLDDIYATVVRQAYFVLFEKVAHDLIAKGATTRDLSAAYFDTLRQQFGKAVPVPDEFRWEWLSIPHIFGSPFYCYAYSFGNLLVLALYQQYRRQGQAFVPQYLELLAAGGSKSPEAILSKVGVDIRSAAFWQSGFDTIAEMVAELERTAA
ncbi:MAG TPA: M3 family oligoendopeptidase [Nitrospiraceae bacterium]|jgi:oligoendopeptidase F